MAEADNTIVGTEGGVPGNESNAQQNPDNTPGLTNPGEEVGGTVKEESGVPGLTNPEPDSGAKETGKEGGGQKDGDTEPAGYKLNVPDGFILDEKMVADATPLLQKYKVTNEDAQLLSDLVCQKVQAEQDARNEGYAEVVKGWQKDLMADSAIGGEKLTPALKTGLKALNRFGDTELTEILRETGLEYHPAVVRFFHKVGLAISEDGGSGASGQPKKVVQTASMFYGNAKGDN